MENIPPVTNALSGKSAGLLKINTAILNAAIISFLVFINIIKEFELFFGVNSAFINAINIFVVLLLLFLSGMKLSERLYPLFLIAIIILFSTFLNASNIDQGGLNTLIMSIAALVLLSIKINLDEKYFSIFLYFLSLFLLAVSYYFYFTKSQIIAPHLSFILSGPFGNQNTLAMSFTTLAILHSVFSKKTKIFYAILAILAFSVFLTQSRAGILIMVSLIIWIVRRNGFLFSSFIILFSSIFIVQMRVFERLIFRILEAGSAGRTEFWIEAIERQASSLSDFLFGFGVGVYKIGLFETTMSVHNSFLNFQLNYGILALILLVFWLFYEALFSIRNAHVRVAFFLILAYGFVETVLFSGFGILYISLIIIIISQAKAKA